MNKHECKIIFSSKPYELNWMFWLLSAFSLIGVLLGALVLFFSNHLQEENLLPFFFSGLPPQQADFLICFSSLLVNLLIFLTLSFLLGLSVFGAVAIPLLTVFRGVTIGLGVSYYLVTEGMNGFGKSALIYTPAAACSIILFILFEVQSLAFSEQLRATSFSSIENNTNFSAYFKLYLSFLCLAVVFSVVSSGFDCLCLLFFSLL